VKISNAIILYFDETPFKEWNLSNCLSHLIAKCSNIKSDCQKDINDGIKNRLHFIINHQGMFQPKKDKALKLYNNVDRFFELKETITFFEVLDVEVK